MKRGFTKPFGRQEFLGRIEAMLHYRCRPSPA
jgi:hypothetical protein